VTTCLKGGCCLSRRTQLINTLTASQHDHIVLCCRQPNRGVLRCIVLCVSMLASQPASFHRCQENSLSACLTVPGLLCWVQYP
jgi:hypothetical protein